MNVERNMSYWYVKNSRTKLRQRFAIYWYRRETLDCYNYNKASKKKKTFKAVQKCVGLQRFLHCWERERDGWSNRLGLKVSGHSTYSRQRKHWIQASSRWVTTAARCALGPGNSSVLALPKQISIQDQNDKRIRRLTVLKPKWINKNQSSSKLLCKTFSWRCVLGVWEWCSMFR